MNFENECQHCGAPRKRDQQGKVIYLRSYECGSFGSLAEENEFTQSVPCMQAQIKRLLAQRESLAQENQHRKQAYSDLLSSGDRWKTSSDVSAKVCRDLTARLREVKEERDRARIALQEILRERNELRQTSN